MDENKQIEEIAKDLCPLYEKYKSCKTCDAVLGVGEEPCFYKCIAKLITAKDYRKQEWISVGDALPKTDARVLVYMHENRMSYTRIDTDRMVKRKWVRWGDCVTHWMPLPQPPKGE